jgi:hypothetical protein
VHKVTEKMTAAKACYASKVVFLKLGLPHFRE